MNFKLNFPYILVNGFNKNFNLMLLFWPQLYIFIHVLKNIYVYICIYIYINNAYTIYTYTIGYCRCVTRNKLNTFCCLMHCTRNTCLSARQVANKKKKFFFCFKLIISVCYSIIFEKINAKKNFFLFK